MTRTALFAALLLTTTAFAQRPPPTQRVPAEKQQLGTDAPKDAKQLNTEGFRLYNEKKYAEAIEKFRAATQADPKFALGWYNLAATLSLMRKEKRTCEFDAYRHNVTDALAKAVALDAGRKTRMQKDPDLDPVRDTIVYQQLLGVNAARKDGLQKLLENVSWWGPATGAYGSMYGVDFQPKGKGTYWALKMDAEGNPKKVEHPIQWKLEGMNILLTLPPEGDEQVDRRLKGKFDGKALVFESSDVNLTDEPSECEA